MSNSPSLVVMLTHNDLTVSNAIEVFEASKHAPAQFWGFKEEGISLAEMKDLVKRMKLAGKTPFLEVVAYTEEECLEGAKTALECGFDYLMGTMFFPSILKLVKNEPVKYLPFVGNIYGRPSILEGTVSGMVEEAKRYLDQGVFGFDLLAYRFTGDPDDLAREFVRNVPAPVCIAGSIASFERLDKIKEINPWAFTIGGAFFEEKFGQGLSFAEQVSKVVEYIEK